MFQRAFILMTLTLALVARGETATPPVSPDCQPVHVHVYNHPGYSFHPQTAMAPYVALSEKLMELLIQSPADTYVVSVKPPWPLNCNGSWVRQMVSESNRQAIGSGLAHATRKGYHLDVVPDVVFCDDNTPNTGGISYATIACHDDKVRAEGKLETEQDYLDLVQKLRDSGVVRR